MVIRQDLRKYPLLSQLGLRVGGTLTQAIEGGYPDARSRKEVREKLIAAIQKLYPEVAEQCIIGGTLRTTQFEKACKKNKSMLYEVAVEAGV